MIRLLTKNESEQERLDMLTKAEDDYKFWMLKVAISTHDKDLIDFAVSRIIVLNNTSAAELYEQHLKRKS